MRFIQPRLFSTSKRINKVIIITNIFTQSWDMARSHFPIIAPKDWDTETDVLATRTAVGVTSRKRAATITVKVAAIKRKRVAFKGWSPDFPWMTPS